MSYILFEDSTDQVVTNTATETTLSTFTIPANILTNRAILLEQTGKYGVNNTASRQYTIRLKLNGTALFTMKPASPGKTTLICANAQRWVLMGIDAGTVRGIAIMASGGPGSDAGSFGSVTSPGGFGTNVLSVDLTADVTLLITVQMSSTGVNHTYTQMGAFGTLVDKGLALSVPPPQRRFAGLVTR